MTKTNREVTGANSAGDRAAAIARYRAVARLGPIWKLTTIARAYTQLAIEGLSTEHIVAIPADTATSILWNLGHLTYSHDHMLYPRCGLQSPLPSYFAEYFRPGTNPAEWRQPWPDVAEVVSEFNGQLGRVQRDLEAAAFARYSPQTIAVGVRLSNLDEAMAFNVTHEGFHAGVVSTLRSLVTAPRF